MATTQGLHRGWFTYADLCTLLNNSKFLEMLTTFRLEVVKVGEVMDSQDLALTSEMLTMSYSSVMWPTAILGSLHNHHDNGNKNVTNWHI